MRFCNDTATEKKRSNAEAEEQQEMLNVDIPTHETTTASHGQEIAKPDHELAAIAGDMDTATKVRVREHDDFVANQKAYGESIKAAWHLTDAMTAEKKDVGYEHDQADRPDSRPQREAHEDCDDLYGRDLEDDDTEHLAFGTHEAHAFE